MKGQKPCRSKGSTQPPSPGPKPEKHLRNIQPNRDVDLGSGKSGIKVNMQMKGMYHRPKSNERRLARTHIPRPRFECAKPSQPTGARAAMGFGPVFSYGQASILEVRCRSTHGSSAMPAPSAVRAKDSSASAGTARDSFRQDSFELLSRDLGRVFKPMWVQQTPFALT